jgi:TolB-like protein
MNKIFLILSLIICSCVTGPKYLSFDDALETGIEKIQNELPEGTQIAILDFKSDNKNLSSYIIEEMYDKLVNSGKLSIMERSRIDTIRMEVDYQLSGEVDDNQIINIGKQLGADFVVTGEIAFSGEAYRLRIFAIDIEKGRRIASSSLNINPNDRQINYLITTSTASNAMSTEANLNRPTVNNIYIEQLQGNWYSNQYFDYVGEYQVKIQIRGNYILIIEFDTYFGMLVITEGTFNATENKLTVNIQEKSRGYTDFLGNEMERDYNFMNNHLVLNGFLTERVDTLYKRTERIVINDNQIRESKYFFSLFDLNYAKDIFPENNDNYIQQREKRIKYIKEFVRYGSQITIENEIDRLRKVRDEEFEERFRG